MNNRIHTTIILAAAAFAACSGLERADIVPATETSRIMLVREGAADVSVYAFRRQGAVFLFDTLFREGWTPDGKLSVRMPNGHYKFLFASGAADRIALQPAPLTRQTSWEEAAFVLRENTAVPGTCFPADELFLQYPASDANTVYTIDGAAQTVRARLARCLPDLGHRQARLPRRHAIRRGSLCQTAIRARPDRPHRTLGRPHGPARESRRKQRNGHGDGDTHSGGLCGTYRRGICPARRAFRHSARRRRGGRPGYHGRPRGGCSCA